MLEFFARGMQSLDEVWYIYPLSQLAGFALRKIPWVHPRASGVFPGHCRKNATTSRRPQENTKRSLMQAKALIAMNPHFWHRLRVISYATPEGLARHE